MPKSSLCYYSDAFILVSGTITGVGPGTDAGAIATNRNNNSQYSNIA